MEKDSVAVERRNNVVKANAALMRDRLEDGAALLRWLKQKRILDAQQPTAVIVTSIATNRVAPDPGPEDVLPSVWRDYFAMPPNDPMFGAPRSTTRSTYEHNLIKHVLHIEQGDIFDDSDDEIIKVEHDVVNEDYENHYRWLIKLVVEVLSNVLRKVVYDLLRGPQRGIVSPLTL